MDISEQSSFCSVSVSLRTTSPASLAACAEDRKVSAAPERVKSSAPVRMELGITGLMARRCSYGEITLQSESGLSVSWQTTFSGGVFIKWRDGSWSLGSGGVNAMISWASLEDERKVRSTQSASCSSCCISANKDLAVSLVAVCPPSLLLFLFAAGILSRLLLLLLGTPASSFAFRLADCREVVWLFYVFTFDLVGALLEMGTLSNRLPLTALGIWALATSRTLETWRAGWKSTECDIQSLHQNNKYTQCNIQSLQQKNTELHSII